MKCEYGPDYIVQEYLKESMALLNCGGRKQAPQSKYAPAYSDSAYKQSV